MPYYLSLGVPYELFMRLNPQKAKPFIKAYELRMEQEDSMMYRQGAYVRDALLSTVCNMFSGKNAKRFEYPEKPYGIEKELTKEEIEKQRELFVASLMTMKANFDLQKKKNKSGEV